MITITSNSTETPGGLIEPLGAKEVMKNSYFVFGLVGSGRKRHQPTTSCQVARNDYVLVGSTAVRCTMIFSFDESWLLDESVTCHWIN